MQKILKKMINNMFGTSASDSLLYHEYMLLITYTFILYISTEYYLSINDYVSYYYYSVL